MTEPRRGESGRRRSSDGVSLGVGLLGAERVVANELGGADFLALRTLYPDVIESAGRPDAGGIQDAHRI